MLLDFLAPRRLRKARPSPAPVLPQVVNLASGALPLVVRRNARAKRMILRIAPGSAALLVTAPTRASASAILDFVERHKGWAEDRLARSASRTTVEDGAVLPFRGRPLTLRHMTGHVPGRVPGRRASRFETMEEGGLVLLVGGAPEHFARRVMDVLKREARADLQAAVDRHARAVGSRPTALALKDTRSRWGSCTADRRLSFSWRIVMAPPEVLDYLAAHEVAHFREMNHGPAFWALCRRLCPQMDAGRTWLKLHGSELQAVHFG